ncbi:MAG: hypothetical protein QOE70_3806 [Chthoniobacter sp.]|nr:hypothetical protein [Chthoniobacter sp.]
MHCGRFNGSKKRESLHKIESDADDMVTEWGFSAEAMDEWDEEHGVYPRLDLSKMTPAQRKRVQLQAIEHLLKFGRQIGG